MEKTIRVECEAAATLPFSELSPFQGELKSLSKKNYERLKHEILQDGFSAPFFVWRQEGQNYILDGHQRLSTVSHMVNEEGYECPELPVAWVNAPDYKTAKRKVLAFTSQYGEMNKQGLYEFLNSAELAPEVLDDFRFPEVNVEKFRQEYFEDLDVTEVEDVPEEPPQYTVAVECKSEQDMQQVYDEMKNRGYECKLIT